MASNIDWKGQSALRNLTNLFERFDELKQHEADDAGYLHHRGLARNSQPRLKKLCNHRKVAERNLAHAAQGACTHRALIEKMGRVGCVFVEEYRALFCEDTTLTRRAQSRLVNSVEGELQAQGLV